MYDAGIHVVQIPAASVGHGLAQFVFDLSEVFADSFLSALFDGGHERSSDAYGGCSEGQCFEGIHSSPDLTVNEDRDVFRDMMLYLRKGHEGRYSIFDPVVVM